MKAVRIHQQGDHASLVYEDAPAPHLATGDVLVHVHAASFVPDELAWPGTWTDRAGRDRAPSIPAHEVAGVAAEYVAVEARNLAPMPESLRRWWRRASWRCGRRTRAGGRPGSCTS